MSSAIFAIYCHILFYSRSGSALRITELDDYRRDSGACTDAAPTDHKCNVQCLSEIPANAIEDLNLDECVKLITGNVIGIALATSGECSALTESDGNALTDGTNCANGKTKYQVYTSGAADKSATAKDADSTGGKVTGDPHVVNMAGKKFDIFTPGAFSFLSLTKAAEENLVINGTVVRLGTKCGQSFVEDLKFTGKWVRQIYNTETLRMRAIENAPRAEALQINFDHEWKALSNLQETTHISKATNALQLNFAKVTARVSVGKYKLRGWNFLNLDVQGLANVGPGVRIGGLLGYDDYTQVSQADSKCNSQKMLTQPTWTDAQNQQSCLSYLKAS